MECTTKEFFWYTSAKLLFIRVAFFFYINRPTTNVSPVIRNWTVSHFLRATCKEKKSVSSKRPNTTKPQENDMQNEEQMMVSIHDNSNFLILFSSKRMREFLIVHCVTYYVICECEKAITNFCECEMELWRVFEHRIKSRLSRNIVLSERLLNCLYVWPNNWINIPNNSFQQALRCCVSYAHSLDLKTHNDFAEFQHFFFSCTKTKPHLIYKENGSFGDIAINMEMDSCGMKNSSVTNVGQLHRFIYKYKSIDYICIKLFEVCVYEWYFPRDLVQYKTHFTFAI